MSLPVCNKDNDGEIIIYEEEALVCELGDWRRVRDRSLYIEHDQQGERRVDERPVAEA